MKIIIQSFLLALAMFTFGAAQSWVVYSSSNSGLPDNDVECIVPDSSGNKWIATIGGGLAVFDGDTTWTIYNSSNSDLPSDDLLSLLLNGPELWVGTPNFGISRYDGTNWVTYTRLNSDYPGIGAVGIAKDVDGRIWATTTYHMGVGVFDGSGWATFTHDNSGLPDDNVLCIAIDRNGTKWIGTVYGGLARFDNNNWSVYNQSGSNFPENNVTAVIIDQNNKVWIGFAWSGIATFDGDTTWTFYNTGNSGMTGDRILSLCADEEGKLWVGTYGGGLDVFDGTNWATYTEPNGELPGNIVNSIYVENKNLVWLGISSVGLVKKDIVTSVKDDHRQDLGPGDFVLSQNYPNPFNPTTTIDYSIPKSGFVKLKVYNLLGQHVADLFNGNERAGKHHVVFDASKLASGVYYYKLESNSQVTTKKMLLLK